MVKKDEKVTKKPAVKKPVEKIAKTKVASEAKTSATKKITEPVVEINTQELIATPEEQIQIDSASTPVKKEYIETGRGVKRRKRIGSGT